jgi:hypothetical protein
VKIKLPRDNFDRHGLSHPMHNIDNVIREVTEVRWKV